MDNVVRYAYNKENERGQITAFYEIYEDRIVLSVVDYGKGIGRFALLRPRGRGVSMLKKIFDEVNFRNAPEELRQVQKEQGNVYVRKEQKLI